MIAQLAERSFLWHFSPKGPVECNHFLPSPFPASYPPRGKEDSFSNKNRGDSVDSSISRVLEMAPRETV